jgi:hypothetical protein
MVTFRGIEQEKDNEHSMEIALARNIVFREILSNDWDCGRTMIEPVNFEGILKMEGAGA